MKSTLMSILEKTGESLDTSRTDDNVASSAPSSMTVAIINGMAELQSLGKPHWISSCKQFKPNTLITVFFTGTVRVIKCD